MKNDSELSSRLHEKYGEIMSLNEVATTLKFPTTDSVRKSLARGALKLSVVRLPQRRGMFVKTSDVVALLQNI